MNLKSEALISEEIESMLVERNLRGMQNLQQQVKSGYCLRAAESLRNIKGTVLIGTGFPVLDTFETDGPVGALILYKALTLLGATPVLVCGNPRARAFKDDYNVCVISVGDKEAGLSEAKKALIHYKPQAIIAIECPGAAENGNYHNMRGEDISDRSACFDFFINEASCPTIAIGDGGNEIGMGNVNDLLAKLDIIPAATTCDNLILSDVSNWGVYGILAFLSLWSKKDLLNETCPEQILKYISKLGSVDGVTRKNELTEDSLPASEGIALISRIRSLIGYSTVN
jgi:hypothetical protein